MSEIDRLIEELDKRKHSGKLPKKFKFKEAGDALVGMITSIAANPFKPTTMQYQVRSLKDGVEYLLPGNVVLNRLLEDDDAKVGDYVLVRFVGTAPEPTTKGFFPKIYEVAVLPKAEAESVVYGRAAPLTQPAQVPQTPQVQQVQTVQPARPVQTVQTVQAVPASLKSTSQAESTAVSRAEPSVTVTPSEEELKVREFVTNVMSFYGELTKEDLLKLVNQVKNYNLTWERLQQIVPLRLDGSKVVLQR